MGVIHVLADGSRATDITGHVVKVESAITVYQLMTTINEREERKKKKT